MDADRHDAPTQRALLDQPCVANQAPLAPPASSPVRVMDVDVTAEQMRRGAKQRIRVYSLDGNTLLGQAQVDRGRPIGQIGRGGFGEVWTGTMVERDTLLMRKVIVKHFASAPSPTSLLNDDLGAADFTRAQMGAYYADEARSQTIESGQPSQLAVTIGAGDANSRTIIMEPGRGESLGKRLAGNRTMPTTDAMAVVIGVSRAVQELLDHRSPAGDHEPLGHFDIKPDNVTTDLTLRKNDHGAPELREGYNVTLIDLDHVSPKITPIGTPGYFHGDAQIGVMYDLDYLKTHYGGAADPYGRQEVYSQARMLRRLITGADPSKHIINLQADDARASYIIARGEMPIECRIGNEGFRKMMQAYVVGAPLESIRRIHAREMQIQDTEIAVHRNAMAERAIAAREATIQTRDNAWHQVLTWTRGLIRR